MLINIIVFILVAIAITATLFAIYYHLEFQKVCRKGFFVSSYNLELLDQKKTAGILITTLTISSALIIAILKQNYIGG